MNVINLKEILIQQNPHWQDDFVLESFVDRKLISKIKLKSKFIEIITGVRRSGKSVILKMLIDKLIKEKKCNRNEILFLNLDYPQFIGLYENVIMLDEVISNAEELTGTKIKYLFLDEIQNIVNWEKWVKAIYDEKIFKKIFITGSNANLLNSRNITRLSGRYFNYENFPFSWNEFLLAKKQKFFKKEINNLVIKNRLLRKFDDYLVNGGFPEVIIEKDLEILNSYYQTILQKDVLNEVNPKNTIKLKELAYWLITNQTSFFSYNKLGKLLGIDETTVDRYIKLLENSFLMFELKKFDTSLRKQMINPKKIYLIDNGIAGQIGFNFTKDKGVLLENLFFLELIRQNSKENVFYHFDKKECDFVVKDGLKIKDAYQICWELNEENKVREVDGLLDALGKYKLKVGYIITRNQEMEIKKDKKIIKIIPIWKWLLQKK
jgi:predicted AAA+ superfamily ATPase